MLKNKLQSGPINLGVESAAHVSNRRDWNDKKYDDADESMESKASVGLSLIIKSHKLSALRQTQLRRPISQSATRTQLYSLLNASRENPRQQLNNDKVFDHRGREKCLSRSSSPIGERDERLKEAKKHLCN